MVQLVISAVVKALSNGSELAKHLGVTTVETNRISSGVIHRIAYMNALVRLVSQPRTEFIPSGLRRTKNGTIRVRSYRRQRPAPTLANMVDAENQDRDFMTTKQGQIGEFIEEQLRNLARRGV